jgi:CRP-like cAMP-binding protein
LFETRPRYEAFVSNASLRDIAVAELGRHLPRKSHPAGTLLMHPDSDARRVLFIVKGCVRLYRLSPGGEPIFYDEIGAGQYLGATAVVNDSRPTFAQAIDETVVEVLSANEFSRLLEHSTAFAAAFVRALSKRMMNLDQRLYEATALPMRVRLHVELLRLADRRSDGTLSVVPPPTHQELALRIGSQREAVSKELARLSREGVLRHSRSSIVILKERQMCDEIDEWMDGAASRMAA